MVTTVGMESSVPHAALKQARRAAMATSEIETQAVLASGGLHLFLSFLFSQVGRGGEGREM